MDSEQLAVALARVPKVEIEGDHCFRLADERGATFYFGQEGERVTISKVSQVTIVGELIEVQTDGERGYFSCDELLGFKVAVREKPGGSGRTGFRT